MRLFVSSDVMTCHGIDQIQAIAGSRAGILCRHAPRESRLIVPLTNSVRSGADISRCCPGSARHLMRSCPGVLRAGVLTEGGVRSSRAFENAIPPQWTAAGGASMGCVEIWLQHVEEPANRLWSARCWGSASEANRLHRGEQARAMRWCRSARLRRSERPRAQRGRARSGRRSNGC
jgi:hypothetical protein